MPYCKEFNAKKMAIGTIKPAYLLFAKHRSMQKITVHMNSVPAQSNTFANHTTTDSNKGPLSSEELFRQRKERVITQQKSTKDATVAQAAREVEEKEPKKKC